VKLRENAGDAGGEESSVNRGELNFPGAQKRKVKKREKTTAEGSVAAQANAGRGRRGKG